MVNPSNLPRRDPIPLDDFLDLISRDSDSLLQRAAAGEISISEWEAGMRELVKVSRNGAAMFAREGRPLSVFERLADWWRRERDIREQFFYLRRFARELRSGQWDAASRLGQLFARARLYINKARTLYEEIRLQEGAARGDNEKRRVLGIADHCNSCVGQSLLGWVPIDSPEVTGVADGSTECDGNCKCTIETRYNPVALAQYILTMARFFANQAIKGVVPRALFRGGDH